MKEKPNYYAILSAEVRYDNRLKANTKLMYAEITALCDMNSECFASNSYFANLYGKSKTSISNWISELVKYKYISLRFTYKEGTKEIDNRYIKIIKGGIEENLNTPYKKTVKSNTTSNNNTNNNINISIRELNFINQVSLLNYDVTLKKEFCDYWTEPNKSNTKMKWELCKTWKTELRLKTWATNQKKWDKPKSNPKSMSKLDAQINEWQKAKELL